MKTTYTAFCQSNAVRTYAPSVCETVRKAPKSQLLVPGTDKPDSQRRLSRAAHEDLQECAPADVDGVAMAGRVPFRARQPDRGQHAGGVRHCAAPPTANGGCCYAPSARFTSWTDVRGAKCVRRSAWRTGAASGRASLGAAPVGLEAGEARALPVGRGRARRRRSSRDSTEQPEPRIEARDDQKMSKCPQLD